MAGILIPATYQLRLKSRQEVAKGTMAFYFERPADFTFKAGQFINLMLLDPPETASEGNTRAFIIRQYIFAVVLTQDVRCLSVNELSIKEMPAWFGMAYAISGMAYAISDDKRRTI